MIPQIADEWKDFCPHIIHSDWTERKAEVQDDGFIIGDDGGLRSWGISTGDDGTRRSQSSAKRSDKKNWWQDMLDAPKKKEALSHAGDAGKGQGEGGT